MLAIFYYRTNIWFVPGLQSRNLMRVKLIKAAVLVYNKGKVISFQDTYRKFPLFISPSLFLVKFA